MGKTQVRLIPMRTIPASVKKETCLGPVFRPFTNLDQFSNTFMKNGYFLVFLTK